MNNVINKKIFNYDFLRNNFFVNNQKNKYFYLLKDINYINVNIYHLIMCNFQFDANQNNQAINHRTITHDAWPNINETKQLIHTLSLTNTNNSIYQYIDIIFVNFNQDRVIENSLYFYILYALQIKNIIHFKISDYYNNTYEEVLNVSEKKNNMHEINLCEIDKDLCDINLMKKSHYDSKAFQNIQYTKNLNIEQLTDNNNQYITKNNFDIEDGSIKFQNEAQKCEASKYNRETSKNNLYDNLNQKLNKKLNKNIAINSAFYYLLLYRIFCVKMKYDLLIYLLNECIRTQDLMHDNYNEKLQTKQIIKIEKITSDYASYYNNESLIDICLIYDTHQTLSKYKNTYYIPHWYLKYHNLINSVNLNTLNLTYRTLNAFQINNGCDYHFENKQDKMLENKQGKQNLKKDIIMLFVDPSNYKNIFNYIFYTYHMSLDNIAKIQLIIFYTQTTEMITKNDLYKAYMLFKNNAFNDCYEHFSFISSNYQLKESFYKKKYKEFNQNMDFLLNNTELINIDIINFYKTFDECENNYERLLYLLKNISHETLNYLQGEFINKNTSCLSQNEAIEKKLLYDTFRDVVTLFAYVNSNKIYI